MLILGLPRFEPESAGFVPRAFAEGLNTSELSRKITRNGTGTASMTFCALHYFAHVEASWR